MFPNYFAGGVACRLSPYTMFRSVPADDCEFFRVPFFRKPRATLRLNGAGRCGPRMRAALAAATLSRPSVDFATDLGLMTRLRILHAVFSSRLAGSERYCVDLANRQAAAGHEVHVAGMKRSPVAAALDARVAFHGFSTPLFRRFLLRRLITRYSFDLCHGHLSAACKALGGVPDLSATAATLHVGYKPHQHERLDALICVNHAQNARLTDYRGVVRTIPNWIPQNESSSGVNLREELAIDPHALVVGSVGRLHASKGMDVLITAFRAAAPANSALVILGEGPQRAELEELRGGDSRIHLPGYRADARACLANFDLFVSPSREESFGLAILEAMSEGLPVIATAAEGPAEFLRNQPVQLIRPDSVNALSTALASAAAMFAGGELARVDYDLSKFDPAERVASITELYEYVLRKRSRVPVLGQASSVAVT